MLSEYADGRPLRKQGGEIWDPVSQKSFLLQNDHLCVKDSGQQNVAQIKISQLPIRNSKVDRYLKFKRTQNKSILVGPSGQSLTCKSERLQECDMNIAYTSGIALWGIFCSGNCLLLTVGVRSEDKKCEQGIQFTAQSPLKISFKLDIQNHTFSACAKKAVHQFNKSVKLPHDIKSWTPFIRIKGLRVNLFLSDAVIDPENRLSIFNIFGNLTNPQTAVELSLDKIEENIEQIEDQVLSNSKLDVLDKNTLIIKGQDSIRLIRRFDGQKQFNVQLAQSLSNDRIKVCFSNKEIDILKLCGLQVVGQAGENCYITKTIDQWNVWGKKFFSFLDHRKGNNEIQSEQLRNRAYEIILRKFQSFRFSQNQNLHPCPVSKYQQELMFGLNKCLFPFPESSFTIPKSITLNNAPALHFNYKIKQILSTQNYLIVWLAEVERLCIVNRQGQLFKITEINLKKGFKKQNQLNQYQKQLDELQSVNSSEPSIYKILKNCLKYADKVKPPQKILNKMEEKLEKKQSKKEAELVPNKSLLNTLLSMGFATNPSKKALLECKNSSLEDAIDLILKKYMNQTEQEKKPAKSANVNKQWGCEVCTLINGATALVCSACQSPKPLPKIEDEIKKDGIISQIKEQQVQQDQKQEQITSQTIQGEEMIKTFAWQSGFAYAPLILGGLFKGKLRIRLFGPNPKYYSIFYHRDQEFVDLSHLTINDEAYQIDQKPVRYQYYASSTAQEQKQAAYGWISIEDQDIAVDGVVKNISLTNIQVNQKDLTFSLLIQYEGKQAKSYEGKILISKIYQEKMRALQITVSQKKQQINAEAVEKSEQILKIDTYSENTNNIPSNGYLQLDLIYQNTTKSSSYTSEVCVCEQVIEKLPSVSRNVPQLPLYCVNSDKSVQMAYPNCPLNPGKRPLILSHLHDKHFSVNTVILQKIGKSTTNQEHTGYFWQSENFEKQPIKKYKFTIPKGLKKICIQFPSQEVDGISNISSYFSIQLVKKQGQDQNLETIEEIGFVGVLGQSYQEKRKDSKQIAFTTYFDDELRIEATQENDELSKDFKYKIALANSNIDLSMFSENRLNKLVQHFIHEQFPVDLKIRIFNLGNKDLILKKLQLPKWRIIRQKSVKTHKKKSIMLQAQYKQLLQAFIENPSYDLLITLLDDGNKDYRSLIVSENYNLTKLFTVIIENDFERPAKLKYVEFIRKFSENLISASKAGNLDYINLLQHILKEGSSKKYSISSVEIVFQLLKLFPCEQQLLYDKIQTLLSSLQKRKLSDHKKKSNFEHDDLTNFGKIQKSQNLIYNRYLVKKGKVYRKYIIDMFNVYEIKDIALTFEKSDKKAPMRITVRSINNRNQTKTQLQIFYNQSTLEQLVHSEQSSKSKQSQLNSIYLPISNLKTKLKSRYLIIQLSFASSPTNASLKQLDRLPHTQIFPQLYGTYIGQYDLVLNKFKINMQSLLFIRNYNDSNPNKYSKYSIEENNYQNTYYYMSENLLLLNQQKMQKSNDLKDSNKEQMTQFLTGGQNKQQKKDKKYTNIIIIYILDQLINHSNTYQLQNQRLIIQFLQLLNSNNLQKGPISQRIILLLKKLCKKSTKICQVLFHQRINNQMLFYQIYKDSIIDITKICQIVQKSEKASQNIFSNSILLCKLKHNTNPQIINRLYLCILKVVANNNNGKIEDVIGLIEKFGWANNNQKKQQQNKQEAIVIRILQNIIINNSNTNKNNNNKNSSSNKQFISIIKSCKSNKKLSQYISTLLTSSVKSYQYFIIGLNQLNNNNSNNNSSNNNNNNNKKVKQQQIHPILDQFMNYIEKKCQKIKSASGQQQQQQQQSSQQQDQQQLLYQQFIILSKNINNFHVKQYKIIQKYIQTFIRMPEKRRILKQFLQIQALKDQKLYSEKVVQIVLLMIGSEIQHFKPSSKNNNNNNNNNNQNLTLIHQLLIFLFRNQIDFMNNYNNDTNNLTTMNNLNQNNLKLLLKIYSLILCRWLNVGGQGNIKISNNDINIKLGVCACLATLVSRNIKENKLGCEEIDGDVYRKLIRWNFINITTVNNTNSNNNNNISNQKNSNNNKTVSNWQKIQTVTWQILNKASKSKSTQIQTIIEQQLDNFTNQLNSKLQRTSSIYYKIYQNRVHCTINKLLMEFNQNQKQKQNVGNRILKNVVFQRMLKKIVSLEDKQIQEGILSNQSQVSSSFGKNDNFIQEKQMANSFVLERVPVQKQPKDWLIYKNGAKNSVYQFQYPKSTQQTYQMILKFKQKQQINPSKIIIGFQYKTSHDETSCIPSQIIVEGGNDIQQLKFIGKMLLQPDDYFINYAVRVFALNVNSISSNNNNNSNTFSNVFKSLNRVPQTKYLRFTITHKSKNLLNQALSITTNDSKQKLLKSSINFLSIQGYYYPQSVTPTPQLSSLISFIKIISQPKYKPTVQQLFKNPKTIALFNDSLSNISLLMRNDSYEHILHKFIMRICQVNTQIGDQTINKYLTLNNGYLCAKIIAEIILANQVQLPNRLVMLNKFIIHNLQEKLSTIDTNSTIITKIQPFLQRFCQIINIVIQKQQNNNDKIDKITIHFTQDCLTKLIKLQNKSQTISKYICLLLSLDQQKFIIPSPVQIGYKQIYTQLKNQTNNTITTTTNQDILYALIISNKKVRQWYMQNNYLQQNYNKIIQLISVTNKIKQKQQLQKIQKQLIVLISQLSQLSANFTIKSQINKNKYNIQIFENLVKQEKLLVAQDNIMLRKQFVEFIIKTVLNTQNQNVIGEKLKQSLGGNIGESNQIFVGEVFLPILNSYNKIPISIIPYDKGEGRILVDHGSLPISSSATPKVTTNTNKNTNTYNNKFRLPSSILSNAQSKQHLFKQFRNKVKINQGQFNLAVNHGSSTMIDNVQEMFKRKQSMLMLFKLVNNDQMGGNSDILGIYHHNSTKSTDLIKKYNDKSLIFLTKQQSNIISFIDIDSQLNKNMFKLHIQQQYDDSDYQSSFINEKTLEIFYNNTPFCQVVYSMSIDNTLPAYFGLGILKKGKSSNMTLQAAQYWFLESSQQSAIEPIKQEQQSLTSLLLESSLAPLSFLSAKFQSTSPLRLLRSLPVYQFPSSITIRQLKQAVQIIKCKVKTDKYQQLQLYINNRKSNNTDNDNKNKLNIENISEETVIGTLHKKNNQEPILDLYLEIDQLNSLLDFTSSNRQKTVEYLPRKGILKYFQENNGITSMIKVLKKSIQSWKNAGRRQKWSQYVLELEKFSSFPHFFGMYLKDPQTFDLLFKLLSGLPDIEINDKKWDELEAQSSQKLLKIVSQILEVDKSSQFRQHAMENQFFSTILQRLRLLAGIYKRQYKQKIQQEQGQKQKQSPSKKMPQDDGTKQVKKKKGVGYGNDGSSNTKWMKGQTQAEIKKQFEVTQIILNMIQNFLNFRNWKVPKKLLDNVFESSLLPYLEEALRAGTLLQISKNPTKFRLVFKILQTFANNAQLIPILLPIPKNYEPRQIQSIQSLCKSLESTANIFLSCLKQNKDNTKNDKVSEQLANLIIETNRIIEEAIDDYKQTNMEDDTHLQQEMKHILDQPADKQYRTLMKGLRFDYMDMKQGTKIKHHYSSSFSQTYIPNQNKMIRLAQQLADISTALPYEHTNAVYVRCDKDRVDFMQALIMGSNGTPYGHGAFLFDVYFDDNYPTGPPKVNLTTTGHGKVRFNPNLYACGKVCLSLLGTWRGSASENWDSKVSTLLQVLLSIQAIIMSQQVYFNEPGFENQQGTAEGQKKNQAYSNIVRYSNVKFAMVENIRTPPKGFETVIRRHFYIKRQEIMQECKKWILYAEKRPANYVGLVNDHNNSWSAQFKKSKTQYKQMLQKAVGELQQQFKKLQPPSIHDIVTKSTQKKKKNAKNVNKDGKKINLLKNLEDQEQQEIDVAYQIVKEGHVKESKEIDINDEKVKDRWSRYIGAMGVDAVSKQSKADVLIFGLGPMALEVVKNLVLSGCRKLTICDDCLVREQDLSGGFFFTETDIGKKRIDSAINKIRQLNVYVKIDFISKEKAILDVIKSYHIVLVTQINFEEQFTMNQFCRKNNVRFISADCRGAYCRLLNDMGDKFQVLDKNGEEPVEVIIKSITSEQTATVTLLDGLKHPFEDNQAILIKDVQGMENKQDPTKSINGTIHRIKVINSKSFTIGDTRSYVPYIRNGTAKNIKTPVILKFNSMKQVYEAVSEKLPLDENMQYYDFTKMNRNTTIHTCFTALNQYVNQNKVMPKPWNVQDSNKFLQVYKKSSKEDIDEKLIKYIRKFSFTCSGYLPPLAAYFGGYISQEIIKAITQKFKPTDSVFYMDAEQIIPQISDKEQEIVKQVKTIYTGDSKRLKGLEIVVGKQLLQSIKNSKLFMIGAGAIGCELLKNFAMVGLGTGQKGKITLTDPDHIENSNLNRQFLFREKHISKPKSRTAAASILLMNSQLKGHVSALLERVSEKTKDIFSNNFFESLTFVANALDNVAARRYVDQRCVQNKIPLFESGTLGPKGHIQVILPYKTESYGSQNDPIEQGEIPHCTLKMFPEETLHCIEWARDIFGKKFSLQPKAFQKLQDKKYKPEKEDIKSLNQCLVMVNKGPRSFDDCVAYATVKFYKYFRDDIMQLLYTYPLDAKTKNGQPFWKLPKRPPTPIKYLDEGNLLHCIFISSMAVMVAKIYKIPYPKNFREQKQRRNITKQACKIKISDFVPSDQKSKEILKQSATEEAKKQGEEQKMMEEEETQMEVNNKVSDQNENQLFEEFHKIAQEIEIGIEEFEKDDDQNGHIDFIHSMANLRALNYKLQEMDWITTKLKAGRIVPALATTTTCVAGLQTLQICKYLKNLKLQSMRNSFLNLAVPSLQMSEPGQVLKTKLTDKLQVNLWDRWQVPCKQKTTFGDIFKYLAEKFELNPIGVLQGMSRIDTSKSEAGKKQFLSSSVLDRLDKQDQYIDIVVLFTKSVDDEKLLENVPPIRLIFEK